MSVLKTIFYIILFYYAFKFLMRLILPVIAQKTVQHMQETFRNQSQQYQQYQQNHEPTARPSGDRQPNQSKKVGEYIDFEEIEEK